MRTGPALLGLAILHASSASALVLPPEDITLSQIHLQFEWPAVAGVTGYDLQVVEDDGSPDPFASAPPVIDLSVGPAEPRAVGDSGLAFGTNYAWRARGFDAGGPFAWGPTHRFAIAALPSVLPSFTATTLGGPLQPGYTLFNLQSAGLSYAIALDSFGEVVFFVEVNSRLGDLRMLPNGRLLATAAGVAVEMLLNGQLAYRTPDGFPVHHEAFGMPNGNVLILTRDDREFSLDGVNKIWEGDRVIEFDHTDNSILWDWTTWDHVSTLDYDPTHYEVSPFVHDWTHGNAVIYDPDDDSVYISLRSISRIVRVDHATGATVYNMGFTMPSGDTDFGDNLFSWQHAPQMLPSGNMLVFDNGNRRDHIVQTPETGVTKAVELEFTGSPPTSAAIVWEWTLPSYQPARGDADRLANGNTLVTSPNTLELHEVDDAGAILWHLSIVPGVRSFQIYRAERIDEVVVDVPGDADLDGLADYVDNCPDHANPDQADEDFDGFGDVCAAALLPEPDTRLALALGGLALTILARRRRAAVAG